MEVEATSSSSYRTEPDHARSGFPPGIPYIVGNEACERFSYYGMRAILFVYLAALFRAAGLADRAADDSATTIFHTFVAGAYALPMVGAVIADRWLGKYRTIVVLSLAYCAGHACLAIFDGSLGGTLVGLGLIAIGAGGIKPCVSAHVGDQFGRANEHLLGRVYQVFYFTINFGAFFATLAIPQVKERFGFAWAFALPGVLMGLATAVFWAGRREFVHVPPTPGGVLGFADAIVGASLFLALAAPIFGGEISAGYANAAFAVKLGGSLVLLGVAGAVFAWRQARARDDGFLAVVVNAVVARALRPRETYSDDELRLGRFWAPSVREFGASVVEGPVAVARLLSIFAMISVFWALFDQQGSSFVAQARSMDRVVAVGPIRFELLPEQIAAANPALVMVLIPLMAGAVYPFVERVLGIRLTPLRRIGAGMVVASLAFVIVALAQRRIDAGEQVSIRWQLAAYVVITLAEVMVSITSLELAYTEAPKRMKSTMSGFSLLAISVGNALVALFSRFSDLPRERFFWTFAAMMAVAAALFALRARSYRYRAGG